MLRKKGLEIKVERVIKEVIKKVMNATIGSPPMNY